jgi:hypothetical protein
VLLPAGLAWKGKTLLKFVFRFNHDLLSEIRTLHIAGDFLLSAQMRFRFFRIAGLGLIVAHLSGCKEPATSSHQGQAEEAKETPPAESRQTSEWSQIDDPKADGWESEVFNELASAHLNKLGLLFFEEGDFTSMVTTDFTCDEVIPARQNPDFEDDLVSVERLASTEKNASLEQSLARIRTELAGDAEKRYFKFKIVRVDRVNDRIKSEQLFSISYQTETRLIEIQSRWSIDWLSNGGDLKIESIGVSDFERSITSTPAPLFSDVTASIIGGNDCFQSQLSFGLNHWLERLPVRAMLNRFGTPGLAMGDVNGDGLDDLYLCQEPGLPNRLFLQNADGTALEAAREWGVDWIDDSRSALLVDLDNDGDQDLVVATYGALVIAVNENGEGFKIASALPTSGSTASLASADYDGDGLLDLYVCAYVESDDGSSLGASGERFVYHDARNGAPNSLYRNSGNLNFIDVTEKTGLTANNHRWSFSASWEDFDNDGDQDLYVANDYGRNNLYRNDEGIFTDIAAEAGVEDSASGMAASWGDYDQDGSMDLYISNMFSSAGNRIVSQQQFKPESDEELRGRFLRFARGNTLLRNLGNGSFADTSESAGVTLGRWAWGSNFIDVNNDSWQDLVVANGYLSSDEDSGDL